LEMRAQKSAESEAARRVEREKTIAEAIKEFVILPPLPQGTASPGGTPQKQSHTPGTPTLSTHRDSKSGRPAGPPRDMSGVLVRKHEWESDTKKASARSWHRLYFVLTADDLKLSAYKDERHAKDAESKLFMGGCQVAPASNYTKRPHVFRLRMPNGGESLFQAKDQERMLSWINAINACIQAAGGASPQVGRSSPSTSAVARSATLPPQSSAQSSTGRSPHDTSTSSSGIKSKILTLGRSKK
ncbi:Spectrin beta chain, non-erythrocytic 1, partial [Cichlidogyrus casuarinus]